MKWTNKITYGAAFLLAGFIFIRTNSTINIPELQIVRLTDWYGLIAAGFLYLALLAGPLYNAIPSLSGRGTYFAAQKALGICAFGFGCLHGSFAFFWSLQGFGGLAFLPHSYRGVLGLGFVTLTILFVLSIASFKPVKEYLGGAWEALQKFIYIAGILILIHSTLIGSHFVNLGRALPQMYFLAVFLLLFLESIRVRDWLQHKAVSQSYVIWILLLAVLLFGYYSLAFSNSHESFHVH